MSSASVSDAESRRDGIALVVDMPLVSVVVAAFNAEAYLSTCLESLLDQTLSSLEIVVVDDGSTDRTAAIASEFRARAAGRFTLVRQANGGTAAARNTGITTARGRYLGFVDADDWADPEMFEVLTDAAERCAADVVIGGGVMVDHATGVDRPFEDLDRWRRLVAAAGGGCLDPRTEPELFLLDASVCKRLVRLEFLRQQDFRFPRRLPFEDVPANYRLLLTTDRVLLVDRALYHYRTGHPGRTTDRSDDSLLGVLDALALVVDDLERFHAGAPVWARFLWFETWLLRWLAHQIDERHRDRLAAGAVALGKRFPASALAAFDREFASDPHARLALAAQGGGLAALWLQIVRREVPLAELERGLGASGADPDGT